MSRSKKKKNKARPRKPDDYFAYGPFEIARYGKYTVFHSNMTSEQFAKTQNNLIERFPVVCDEIDRTVLEIADRVRKYPPTELLHIAYTNFINNSRNIISEVDINHDGALSLRMLDYIQSVIASVPADAPEELTEDNWEKLKELVDLLFHLINYDYQISRTAVNKFCNPGYDDNYEEYHYHAQMIWCNVRGQRYLYHQKMYFHDVLSVHSDILLELFGITSEQLINEIVNIQEMLTRGIANISIEMDKFRNVTLQALEKKLNDNNACAETSLPDLMHDVIKENGWEDWKNNIFDCVFGLGIFDLEKNTKLPITLLEELSWSQGQDIEFFSEGKYKGWPLRIWPIFKRPFIKLDNHYYCFELHSLFDNLYRVLEKTICRINPSYRDEWNKKQKEISENLPFKYFKKILPNAKVYTSVYYKWHSISQDNKQWCETDGILIYDDHLFIVEVKAGAFTYTSPANDFPAYIDSIKNLVCKPVEQGKRFLEYLKSQGKVEIFNNKHQKITELSNSDFNYTHICAITLDHFTEIASQVEHINSAGIDSHSQPVWSVSIDDLRVYSDIFDNSLVFLHFMEQRMKAFQSSLIRINDELDHLGLYLEHNLYSLHAQEISPDEPVNWHGYRKSIDTFFYEKLIDPNTECPLKQKMPSRLKEIIDVLDTTHIRGRRIISSLLLNYGGERRNKIATTIDEVILLQQNLRRPQPFSVQGDTGITFFCWQDGIVQRDISLTLEHSKAEMVMLKDDERILIEIFLNDKNTIYNVDFQFIKRDSITEYELGRLEVIAENLRKKRIMKAETINGKIGLNDPCPCGSGKKYKKCCSNVI